MKRYRAEHPDQPMLYLDAGRTFVMRSQEADVVIPHMIEAFDDLGLDVLNPGEQDLDAGFSIFRAIGNSGGFKAVSANLVSIDGGEPALPPYTIVTPRIASGRASGPRIAVVGLTKTRRYRVIEGIGEQKLHFIDPMKAADDILPKARAGSDLVVVLGNFGMGFARELAARHPEIDLVVAADQDQYDPLDMVFNEVPICMTGILGKYAVRLDVFKESGKRRWRVTPEMTKLDGTVEPDLDAARFMQRYLGEIEDRTRRRGDAKRDPRSPDYVGAAKCAGCHREASAVWAGTRHAHAWEPLAKSNSTLNPLCLECHTVGYLKPNGFFYQNDQPELTGVGCESCHGPGGSHVKEPARSKMAHAGEETCRGCHTKGQSPGFDFPASWELIRH